MDISTISNLGVAGFSILVMWWMYQSAAAERKACDARLDQRDESYRKLEFEVRTEISAQLTAATSTIGQNQKVMERVLDKLSE